MKESTVPDITIADLHTEPEKTRSTTTKSSDPVDPECEALKATTYTYEEKINGHGECGYGLNI